MPQLSALLLPPLMAFAIHVLWWRVKTPTRHTRTLGLIFLTCYIAALLLLLESRWPISLFTWSVGYWALSMSYIITYSAFEAQSPSLLMILAVHQAGQSGLPVSTFTQTFSDDLLVKPRVMDLCRDGHLQQIPTGFQLTTKGRRFISLFIAYRSILGLTRKGG